MILAYTENVAMATMMTHFNRAYLELFNDASHQSLSQIEVEIERFKVLPLILAVTQSYIGNVTMATMMNNYDRAHRELSNGASTTFLSHIKVEIKGFENVILKNLKYGCHGKSFMLP